MKSLRRTLLGMVILLLLGGAAAGTYFYFIWERSDELLRASVVDKLNEIAPGWNFQVTSAWLDLSGQVHLKNVIVPGDDPALPLLESPEVVLIIDRETLAQEEPEVRRIQFLQPRANFSRGTDGVWNFQRLPPLRHPRSAVPEFQFSRATVALRLDRPDSGPSTSLRLDDVNVQMVPAGKRQFLIKSFATVPGIDELTAEGTLNLEERSWTFKGQARNLQLDRRQLSLVAEFSPEFRRGFARIEGAIGLNREHDGGATEVSSAAQPEDSRRGSFSASVNVQFCVSQWQREAPIDYQLFVQVLQGEVSHPAIEYPLRELRGQLQIDNSQVECREMSAKSGTMHIRVERGRIREEHDLRPADFDLLITDLPLDERLYRLMPAEMREVYDSLQPAGRVDARLHFEYNGRDRWDHEGELTARDCSAAHVKFPYRVEQINGNVKREGNLIKLELAGRSGAHRISLRGQVKDPGPEAAALFFIETAGLPIDDKLRDACPPGIRMAVDRLNVQGLLDGWVRLSRRAGRNQAVIPQIQGRLRNGTVNFSEFPYPLSEVTGEFVGNPQVWSFTNFKGKQGQAEMSCRGEFRLLEQARPQLELEFEAGSVPCDRVLFSALPAKLQEVWNEFTPQGTLDLAAGTVQWSAGAAPQIGFDARLHDGEFTLKSFPLPFEDVEADVNWNQGQVTIRAVSGRHDEMQFRAAGNVDFPEPDEWHVHLKDLHVENLEADRAFRKALPERLRTIVDAFNPRGKLWIMGVLDFRGRKGTEFPVTAAWSTHTVYTDNTITAGVDLKEMHGKAQFEGQWDGQAVTGQGWIDLNSVKVFDYQLANVSGPVSIDGKRLFVGSKEFAERQDQQIVDNSKRLTARFIEGQIGLDAAVDLGETMSYRARITLNDGELKRFAQLHLPNHRKLAGVMNGWVDLQGVGTDPKRLVGGGQLLIAPAALYELPLIVAIMDAFTKSLTLTPAKDVAFEEALFKFQIRNSTIEFRPIDLVGDAMRFVGMGTVRFNGAVNMDFASRAGRGQMAIPVIGPAIGELIKAGTNGWVGVKVTGTVQSPETVMVPLPQLNAAFQELFKVFEPRTRARR